MSASTKAVIDQMNADMNEKWDGAIIALQEHIEKRLYHGLDLSDVPSCKAAIVLLQKARVVTREDVLRHTAGFAVESVAEVLIELGEKEAP